MQLLLSLLLLFTCALSFAEGKACLQRKDLTPLYSQHNMRFVENYGHVLAIKQDKFNRENGFEMDIYAQKKIPITDKVTKLITHYKKCLFRIKKDLQGKYIYGSFTSSGVEVKMKNKIQRVSFQERN